ncbi:cell wall integrity and stress response component [Microdochium nivale]|nr:cell wall integrity and stress response component [Microdochium nivale]
MSLPKPDVPLKGDCSVIHDGTLYSYSAAAFQSLKLEEGATWNKLPAGVSVEGGVCVGSTPADAARAGFFVVGGTGGKNDYTGLQKFSYASKTWETLTPNADVPNFDNHVTKNRRWHSAIYMPASGKILIFAGSDDGVQFPSASTFAVDTTAPYKVSAFDTNIAPPAVAPLLLPWSDTQAVMVGGGPTNTNVVLFDFTTKWVSTGASLAAPLQDPSVHKAALMRGEDSSVHLYTFDATTSPTTVRRIMLWNEVGAPIEKAVPVEVKGGAAANARRQLTAHAWPQYNATLAPMSKRSEYSFATSKDGLMVLAGGSDNDVLAMFDGKRNAWMNATDFLVGSQFVINSSPTLSATSSTVSTTSTSTSDLATATSSSPLAPTTVESATPSETAAAAAISTGLATTTILGIVLGVVFGLVILLALLLLCIKRARAQRAHAEAGHARRASGYPVEKDYSRYNMSKASGPFVRGHQQQGSAASFSSMAILMGKVQQPALQRKLSSNSRRSSASSIFNKNFKSTIGKPQLHPSPQIGIEDKEPAQDLPTARPRPRNQQADLTDDGMRRSSGWNRYWSGGSTLNVLGFGGSNSKRQTVTSDGSRYSDMNRMTQDSATVPPLRVEGGPSFYSVNTGSPTVSQHNPHIREHSGTIEERPVSAVSALSSSGYSSGIPASIRDSWDATDPKSWAQQDRAASSMYSHYTVPAQSNFQHTQASLVPQSTASRPPTGLSQQPQLSVAATSSDMSWLNLGNQSRNI